MAFDNTNADERTKAYDYARARPDSYYNSPIYTKAVERYKVCTNAYYRRKGEREPVWKSKLYFGTFFIACKAFEAKIKSSLQQDIVALKIRSRSKYDKTLEEKERIAEFDLRNDLKISDFKSDLYRAWWYNGVFGVSAGRESFTSDVFPSVYREVAEDQYGNEIFQETENVDRKEHTKTDVVHPLNFAHDPMKAEFTQSDWASVRYPLPIREVYRMLTDPMMKKDKSYIREDIAHVIAEIEKGGANWTPDSTGKTYFVDNPESFSSSGSGFAQNSIIVEEYSGDLNFAGNYNDANLYFGIYVPQYKKWLRIGKSPFRRHPYWKQRTYPDPMSPYAIGAADLQIPLGIMKNSIANQYIDWGNANLKYMYEVYPGKIRGGLASLISGLPGGLVEASTSEHYDKGPMLRPVVKERGSIPAVADILNFLERASLDSSAVNSKRSEVGGRTDTATGIMDESKREDDVVSSIIEDMDRGLTDCMNLKISNRIDFSTQPVIGSKSQESPHVRYFPFELGGSDYEINIDRTSGTSEANKYMAFMVKVQQAMQAGLPLPPESMLPLFRRIGRKLDIPEAEDIFAEKPVDIGGGAQPGGSQSPEGAPMGAIAPTSPSALPPVPPAVQEPTPSPQGASNAMALAA